MIKVNANKLNDRPYYLHNINDTLYDRIIWYLQKNIKQYVTTIKIKGHY